MRCWRTPTGRLLVEQFADDPASYLELDGPLVVAEHAELDDALSAGSSQLPDDSLSLTQVAAVVDHAPLRRLVARVYDTFAREPRPDRVTGCPHCVAADEDLPLLTTPLRELSYDQLERYLWKAVTTWGSAADFRYFVPRVLEIVVLEEPRLLDLHVVLGKLRLAGFTSWDADERGDVDHLLSGWWGRFLDRYPTTYPVTDVLPALALILDEPAVLARWGRLTSPHAVRHLRDLLGDHLGVGMHLAPEADPDDAVDVWLHSAALREAVDAAFFAAGDPDVAAVLSDISDYLTSRPAPSPR